MALLLLSNVHLLFLIRAVYKVYELRREKPYGLSVSTSLGSNNPLAIVTVAAIVEFYFINATFRALFHSYIKEYYI